MITILHRFYMYIHFYLFTLQKITEQKHEYALRLRNGIYFTGNYLREIFRFPFLPFRSILFLQRYGFSCYGCCIRNIKLQNLPDSSILPKQVSYLSDYSSAVA